MSRHLVCRFITQKLSDWISLSEIQFWLNMY